MNTLKGSLLSFDFDGTLYGSFETPCVSSECIMLIHQMSLQGALWGINTGRSYELLAEGVEQAHFLSAPDFIIVKEREVFFREEQGGGYKVDELWKKKCDTLHREMYDREEQMVKRVKCFVETQTAAEWISEEGDEAGIIAKSMREMDQIVAYIDTQLETVSGVGYLRSTIYLRFTHVDFHKGTSLGYVAAKFKVAVEKTFAIGDDENDLGMLHSQYAGRVACPANAAQKVKNRVREEDGFVADAEVSEGVVEALKHHFKEELKGEGGNE